MALASAASTASAAPSPEDEGVRPFVWTRVLLRQAVEAGVILEGDRVDLVEGELVVMPVQNEPHAVACQLVEDRLREVFRASSAGSASYHVRSQKPVALGEHSEPEPDIAVVRGSARDYLSSHPAPEAVALLVEVSDSTLRYDRGRTMSLYARFGIAEAWLLNLQERVLEVYREPVPDTAAAYGSSYQRRAVVPADGQVSPLAALSASLSVAELLP